MKIDFDLQDILPLIRQGVQQALEEIRRDNLRGQDRIAYTEPEAAALLGVKPHVLRSPRNDLDFLTLYQ